MQARRRQGNPLNTWHLSPLMVLIGVIALKPTEIGCLTPPVGLNAFAMKGVVGKEISLETIFRGCMPFIALESVCLIILVIFPGISTWLPNLLFGN